MPVLAVARCNSPPAWDIISCSYSLYHTSWSERSHSKALFHWIDELGREFFHLCELLLVRPVLRCILFLYTRVEGYVEKESPCIQFQEHDAYRRIRTSTPSDPEMDESRLIVTYPF